MMVWVMGLRKYGHVAEVPDADATATSATRAVERVMSTVVNPASRRRAAPARRVRRRGVHELRRLHRRLPAGHRPAAPAAVPLRRARAGRPRAWRRARPSSPACSAVPARRAARPASTSPRTCASCATGCCEEERLMPLPTRDVVGILADNLRLRGSVLPIPARRATRWARELDLPRGGETVLYTGMMYQLVPVHRAPRRARAAARRFAARPPQRRSRAASTGSSTAPRSSRVRRPASAPSTTACPRTSRGCCAGRRRVRLPVRGRPLLGRACPRPRRRRGRRRARPRSRAIFRKHGVKRGDHDRPAHDDDAADRLPEARRRLRRRGAQLPRGARRARAARRRRSSPARSCSTTRASTRATRTSSSEPRELLAATGLTVGEPRTRGG